MADLTAWDRAALGWFLLVWLGYELVVRAARSRRSIASRMLGMRRAWMLSMLGRENRITDASLIGHAVHSATFFASTTVVVLAALLGMLGNLDRTHAAVEGLSRFGWAGRRMRLVIPCSDLGWDVDHGRQVARGCGRGAKACLGGSRPVAGAG